MGSISGIVTDIDKEPIPGVTITASSPALIGGTSTAFTDNEGNYRIPALAPGIYQVNAELQGFQSGIQNDVRVFVGLTITVNFTLEVEEADETLEIIGEPPLIDITTSTTTFSVTQETIESLPKPKSIETLLALTPGVGDDLVAYGSSEFPFNAYWVDGVDISNPRGGGIYAPYNYDWIQEVEVISLGAQAEYGDFSGVVGNFITRSGGNDFHGLVQTIFSNENLVSTNTPDAGEKAPFKEYDLSAQVGGRILRDKLWFFTGVQYAYQQDRPFGYSGNVINEYPKAILKLTSRLNSNNTLQGFAHYNHQFVDGFMLNPSSPPETSRINKADEGSWNTSWISLISSNTTFEGRIGGFLAHYAHFVKNGETPPHLEGSTGVYSQNGRSHEKIKRGRNQVNATLSHYAADFLAGNHDFRFGVEWERSEAHTISQFPGGIYYYDYYGAPFARYLWEGYDSVGKNRRVSSYIQDHWDVTANLAFDLGVRWDHNLGNVPSGTIFRTDPISPRLGIVYNFNDDHTTVLKANFGDFYEALRTLQYEIPGGGYPDQIVEFFDNGEWIYGFSIVGSSAVSIDSRIKQPYVRQFSMGIDRDFSARIALGAHYIYRKWHNIIEDVLISGVYEPFLYLNPVTGQNITLYKPVDISDLRSLITNPSGLFRRYDGFEIYANGRVSRKLSLSGSFLYSRIKGNTPNIPDAVKGTTGLLDDPNTTVNFTGHLKNDPTIAWKIVGNYQFAWGISSGWYFRHESGDRWTPIVQVPAKITGTQPIRFFGLPQGSNRFDDRNILDLRLEKQFNLAGGQLAVLADVFNVFNAATVISVQRVFTLPDFGEPNAFDDPRRIRLGLRYNF
jgi:hypothetical protein